MFASLRGSRIRQLAASLVFFCTLLATMGIVKGGSPCNNCLDVHSYLMHINAAERGRLTDGSDISSYHAAACGHFVKGSQLREMCAKLALARAPSDKDHVLPTNYMHPCLKMGVCTETDSLHAPAVDMPMPPKLANTVALLQTGVGAGVRTEVEAGVSLHTSMNSVDKFGIKMFIYSVKSLIPIFWQLRYERTLSQSLHPSNQGSLLEISSDVVGLTPADRLAAEAAHHVDVRGRPSHERVAEVAAFGDSVTDAVILLQTALRSKTGTGWPWWIFLYIAHWFYRWVHWLSWVVKYRLLIIRYWTSKQHDHTQFIYRPRFGGWGWEAHYRYHFGVGGGGGGSENFNRDLGLNDKDEFDVGSDGDGSVISPPLEEQPEEEEEQFYNFNDRDRYGDDAENNDAEIAMKPFNCYDENNPNCYPDAAHNASNFIKPSFGQPTTYVIRKKSDTLSQEALMATQLLPQLQQSLSEGPPPEEPTTLTLDDLESRAKAAFMKIKSTAEQDVGVAANARSWVNANSGPGRGGTTELAQVGTGVQMHTRTKTGITSRATDAKYSKDMMFPGTEDASDSFGDVDVESLDFQIRDGLADFRNTNRYVAQHVSPREPVDDPAVSYTAAADAEEREWAKGLDREFYSMERTRPELHAIDAGTDQVFGLSEP